jgi:hypothetical protein
LGATGSGGGGVSGSTMSRRSGGAGGGGRTGWIFNSTGFSGGSSIALGASTGGTGATISVTAFRFGAGTGAGRLMGVGSGSGRSVIGDRYWTTERTVCTIGADCSTSHSSARCSTPVLSRAGREMRGA